MFRIKKCFWCFSVGLWLQACTTLPPHVPEGFVWLSQVDPTIVQAMAYAGPDNFVGTRVDGYEAGACILTAPAAKALARAQMAANENGLSLIVFDCYRPQRSVDHFVRWSKNTDGRTKAEYYPNVPKADLFDLGYIAERSGHSRGSTVDVALVPLSAQAGIAKLDDACTETSQPPVLDFGTRFDCFDALSNTAHPGISAEARANRTMLVDVMTSAGFRNYAKEWWHFTLTNEPHRETYFSFPVLPAP